MFFSAQVITFLSKVNHLLKMLQNPYNEAVREKYSRISNSLLCDSDTGDREKDDIPHGYPSVAAAKLGRNIDYQSKVPVWACNIRIS